MNKRLMWLLMMLVIAFPVFACQCGGEPVEFRRPFKTMRQRVEFTTAYYAQRYTIFEGEVEKMERVTLPNADARWSSVLKVTFNNVRAYRGTIPANPVLYTGFGCGDCAFEFDVAQKYLVYASDQDGLLSTFMCLPTKSLESAGPELRYLRGEPPAKEDLLSPQEYQKVRLSTWKSTISGYVTRADGTPLESPKVRITRIRGTHGLPECWEEDASVNPDGSFHSDHLVPGRRYLVEAEEKDTDVKDSKYIGYYPSHEIDNAKLVQVDENIDVEGIKVVLAKQPLHRFNVFVIGRPSDYWVTLEREDANGRALGQVFGDSIKNSRALFDGVPEGRYLLTVVDYSPSRSNLFLTRTRHLRITHNTFATVFMIRMTDLTSRNVWPWLAAFTLFVLFILFRIALWIRNRRRRLNS